MHVMGINPQDPGKLCVEVHKFQSVERTLSDEEHQQKVVEANKLPAAAKLQPLAEGEDRAELQSSGMHRMSIKIASRKTVSPTP
jgi:hypothetical protein